MTILNTLAFTRNINLANTKLSPALLLHCGPYLNDIRKIFRFLTPHLHQHFTQPISTDCPQNWANFQPPSMRTSSKYRPQVRNVGCTIENFSRLRQSQGKEREMSQKQTNAFQVSYFDISITMARHITYSLWDQLAKQSNGSICQKYLIYYFLAGKTLPNLNMD